MSQCAPMPVPPRWLERPSSGEQAVSLAPSSAGESCSTDAVQAKPPLSVAGARCALSSGWELGPVSGQVVSSEMLFPRSVVIGGPVLSPLMAGEFWPGDTHDPLDPSLEPAPRIVF